MISDKLIPVHSWHVKYFQNVSPCGNSFAWYDGSGQGRHSMILWRVSSCEVFVLLWENVLGGWTFTAGRCFFFILPKTFISVAVVDCVREPQKELHLFLWLSSVTLDSESSFGVWTLGSNSHPWPGFTLVTRQLSTFKHIYFMRLLYFLVQVIGFCLWWFMWLYLEVLQLVAIRWKYRGMAECCSLCL